MTNYVSVTSGYILPLKEVLKSIPNEMLTLDDIIKNVKHFLFEQYFIYISKFPKDITYILLSYIQDYINNTNNLPNFTFKHAINCKNNLNNIDVKQKNRERKPFIHKINISVINSSENSIRDMEILWAQSSSKYEDEIDLDQIDEVKQINIYNLNELAICFKATTLEERWSNFWWSKADITASMNPYHQKRPSQNFNTSKPISKLQYCQCSQNLIKLFIEKFLKLKMPQEPSIILEQSKDSCCY